MTKPNGKAPLKSIPYTVEPEFAAAMQARRDAETAPSLNMALKRFDEMQTTQEQVQEQRIERATHGALDHPGLVTLAKQLGVDIAKGGEASAVFGAALFDSGHAGHIDSLENVKALLDASYDEHEKNRGLGDEINRDPKKAGKAFTFVRAGMNSKMPRDYLSQCREGIEDYRKSLPRGKDDPEPASRYEMQCTLNRKHETADRIMTKAEMAIALTPKEKEPKSLRAELEVIAKKIDKLFKDHGSSVLPPIGAQIKAALAEMDYANAVSRQEELKTKVEADRAKVEATRAAWAIVKKQEQEGNAQVVSSH